MLPEQRQTVVAELNPDIGDLDAVTLDVQGEKTQFVPDSYWEQRKTESIAEC